VAALFDIPDRSTILSIPSIHLSIHHTSTHSTACQEQVHPEAQIHGNLQSISNQSIQMLRKFWSKQPTKRPSPVWLLEMDVFDDTSLDVRSITWHRYIRGDWCVVYIPAELARVILMQRLLDDKVERDTRL
jgi:hypothetical protein